LCVCYYTTLVACRTAPIRPPSQACSWIHLEQHGYMDEDGDGSSLTVPLLISDDGLLEACHGHPEVEQPIAAVPDRATSTQL
jgi:hypothetical protein